MLDQITKTIPSAKQENSRRIKQRSRLAPFGRFLLRWSWYIVLSMTLLFITSSFVPDIPSPDKYQATLPVQVQLPRGLNGAINIKATATFFAGLFVSPATLSAALPALHTTAAF